MRYALGLLLCFSCLAGADNWTPRPGFLVRPDGRIAVGGLSLELTHWADGWQRSSPPKAVQASGRQRDGVWQLDSPWALAEGVAQLHQTVRIDGTDALRLEAQLEQAGPTKSFALSITLDSSYRNGELRIDGASLALPEQSPQPQLHSQSAAKLIAIPVPAGGWLEISGDLRILVQDNRTWNSDTFSVRIIADAAQHLTASLRLRQVVMTAIPLGPAATIPRRDDVAGDEQGGWTDQGDNDLRAMPSGTLDALGRPFEIGDNAIVLAGEHVANRPTSADVIIPDGGHGAALYLLHAAAWAPKSEIAIGKVHLHYRDGSSETREVVARRDVADWWNPAERLPNAGVGWSGDNPHARVGLYVCRIPIPDRPLQSVGLEVIGGAVWMIAGMALGEDAPLPSLVPDVITAGLRWRPTAVPWEVEPGSALDLSSMTAAPVPGRLITNGSHFVLDTQPDVPVRLLGANLCFSANYPEKPVAERMAVALRAMGHNSVRIHHFDGALVPKDGDGSTLDPDAIDRLDYLVACCKKAGLWITTDVYVSRSIPKGAIAELPDQIFGQEFKALIPLLPSAMENWKRFATTFLTHTNPYTGMTWGEDPALATLSMVNEDNLHAWLGRNPVVQKLYDERFAAYIATRPADEQNGKGRSTARARWLYDLQTAAYAAMRAHVRSLGVQAPTTSANMQQDWWSLALRNDFDFVDNHAYHDHPGFPVRQWSLPYSQNQRSAVENMLSVPARLAQSRRLDRPFTVTELNYCAPNHRRSEYAAGVAAVAGLQDWSGVWRFAFSHQLKAIVEDDAPMTGFDLVRDPIALLGERAMALLYRRGDVIAAPWSAAVVYDPAVANATIGGQPNGNVALLALHARVGCLPSASAAQSGLNDLRCLLAEDAGGTVPTGGPPVFANDDTLPAALTAAGLITAGDIDSAARRVTSATGQMHIDGKARSMTVATRRSVAAVLPGGTAADIGGVRISNTDVDLATVVVAALDGTDLATAKRILVLHLTDAQNSGTAYASRQHTLLDSWGKAPVLVRSGAVSIHLPGTANAQGFALDLRGTRQEEIALPADGDGYRLDASVVRTWGPCLAWEIVRR
jgi:hypothetical protein